MNLPKISIIIPVYNGGNYLEKAIDCALQQTYDNIEVIVVNDGSADNGETEKIALSYGDRIRYFSKPNGGVSSALNLGISNMKGEYFSWLSHDDAYSPDKIKNSVDLLIKNNAIGTKTIAFTSGYFIDSSDSKIKSFPIYFGENKLYSGVDVIHVMTKKGTLNGCCMLIPKTAFDDAGLFNESLRYSQDSLMWYKIFLSDYSLVSDNKPNVMYRLHRKQTSQLRHDLYEHDSLVIAKLLAEPLAKADENHKLLFQYVRRLSKYQCNDAIDYICNYANENQYWGLKSRMKLRIYRFFGFFRYKAVFYGKRVLILFRQ